MRVCIIGCGVMGGLMARCLAESHEVHAYDHNPAKLEALTKTPNIYAGTELEKDLRQANMILLAIKPQGLGKLAKEIQPYLQVGQVLASVLAGITVAQLKQYFPESRILRMMPNIAMAAHEGVIGIADSPDHSLQQKAEITQWFQRAGLVQWIPEDRMNALNALSGSGIAFVFLLLEAMTEAGISMGFSSQMALELARQTMQGAVAMTADPKQHPAALKWSVCSPSGTTIAGIMELERQGVRAGMHSAIVATYQKANNMHQESLRNHV